MLRVLQSIEGKNIDAEKKAKADIKRGTFVKVSEKAGTLELAVAIADVNGIVTRDFVVTQDSALGLSVSDYDVSQDLIKAGEYAAVQTLLPNEMYATSEYDPALLDGDVDADKHLTVTNGKLAKSATATSILSLGWVTDAGINKLLAFKVLK